jgi:hypothetical protein
MLCLVLAVLFISAAAAAFTNQVSPRLLVSPSRSFGSARLRSDAATTTSDTHSVQSVPLDRFRYHTAQLCWHDRLLILNDGSAITSQVDLKFHVDELTRLSDELRSAVECESKQLQQELSVLQEKMGDLNSATDEMSSVLSEMNRKFGAITGFLYNFAVRGGIFRYDFYVFVKVTMQIARDLETFIAKAELFIQNYQRCKKVADVPANVKHLGDVGADTIRIIDGEFSECSKDLLDLYDYASETFGEQGQALWALTNRVDHFINELNNLNYHAYEANRKLGTVLDLQQKFTDSKGKGPTARNAVAELSKHASAWEKAKKRRIERNRGSGKRTSGNVLLDFARKVKSLFTRGKD